MAVNQEALRLNPESGLVYANLVASYLPLDRLDEVKATAQEAQAHHLDSPNIHINLYQVAFFQHDTAGMEREAAAVMGKPGFEDVMLMYESTTLGYAGQFAKKRELLRRAVDSAIRADEKETAAFDLSNAASHEAIAANAAAAKQQVQAALALSNGRDVVGNSAIALALAGDSGQAMPYRVYAAQQDSGTAAVLSRSDYGEILLQDWYSIGGFEYAFITPDPAHPNLVYSGGWYGSVVRRDESTGQVATVFERGKKYRASQMPPLIFSPQDASTLYLGMQFVLKTVDSGQSWREISPDLSGYGEQEEPEKPDPDKPRPPAITALSPSTVRSAVIWVGTSNRLVQLTRDGGKTWQDVSPPGLTEPTQILYVEASHHDPATAYLTVGARRESTPPCVLRTDDYGKTWRKIVNGFPENEMVRVLREDPKRKGLLYAGTDTGVYVSWDRGDHWQSLSLNLPATPITDLQVHDNDLVISTFGRSLWVLDDISPLREISPEITAANVSLFVPATAMRVRWDNYQDTPYPIETPADRNPPDGAILYYYLKTPPAGEMMLTLYDSKGVKVAQFSSETKPTEFLAANAPSYWFAPESTLSKAAGVNRFVWDLRYPPPVTLPYGYYNKLLEYTEYTLADHAVPGLTPRAQPRGPLILPGKYIVELQVGGQTLRQPLTVELDPRVHSLPPDLSDQLDLSQQISSGMKASSEGFLQVKNFRKALAQRTDALKQSENKETKDAVVGFEKKIDAIDNGTKRAQGFGPVNRDLARILFSVESADIRPADAVRSTAQQSCEALDKDLANWQHLIEQDLPAFDAVLAANKQEPLSAPTGIGGTGCKP